MVVNISQQLISEGVKWLMDPAKNKIRVKISKQVVKIR